MRHGKKFNHLSRTSSHRKAMLSNMAASLILHKRIQTTTAKAKALRKYVEPLITRAKDGSQHNQRLVFSHLQDKEATKELFNRVARKVADRPGGYTRIIKLSITRSGDDADLCFIELVDFNDLMLESKESRSGRTRRGRRRGGSKKKQEEQSTAEATTTEVETPVDTVMDNSSEEASSEPKADTDEKKKDEE